MQGDFTSFREPVATEGKAPRKNAMSVGGSGGYGELIEVPMVTEHRILVSDDVWAQLEAKAQAEGRPVDQLVEDTLRDGLAERSWQDLIAYGQERGRMSGIIEAYVHQVVREWRNEQRGR